MKLIDENIYRKLFGQDKADYVKAVKDYNQSGDIVFLNAALYFENNKENPNSGVDAGLMKRVQRLASRKRYGYRELFASTERIPEVYIRYIMEGSRTGVTNEMLLDLLEQIKSLPKRKEVKTIPLNKFNRRRNAYI